MNAFRNIGLVVLAAFAISVGINKLEKIDNPYKVTPINHTVQEGDNLWKYFRSEVPTGGNFTDYTNAVWTVNTSPFDPFKSIASGMYGRQKDPQLKTGGKLLLPDIHPDGLVGANIDIGTTVQDNYKTK
jgi:hypothetical protein